MTSPGWIGVLRWVLGGAFMLMGAYLVGFNWATIPWNSRLAARGSQRQVSSIPFFGPALLSLGLGCILWRFSPHTLWFWIIDWPTVALPVLLWRRFRDAKR